MTKKGSLKDKNQDSPVLDIQNVTITYDTDKGPLDTVRDVSFKIAPGEIYER